MPSDARSRSSLQQRTLQPSLRLKPKGNVPRLLANTLVFLALDKVRLQDLDEAIRRYLAWKSIVEEHEALNLDPNQVRKLRRS